MIGLAREINGYVEPWVSRPVTQPKSKVGNPANFISGGLNPHIPWYLPPSPILSNSAWPQRRALRAIPGISPQVLCQGRRLGKRIAPKQTTDDNVVVWIGTEKCIETNKITSSALHERWLRLRLTIKGKELHIHLSYIAA
ncbi:unnamed protein product [Clonostachys solani]|uniref:Uncharacterized protein n=1 Tax=Clonostachys solani TaxID=160281 RepID=A0A9N9W1J6_9HYPO|nr:unnamed protein product [Clonostachys solani]